MRLIADEPSVARALRDGYPYEDKQPICPQCGQECSYVYKDRFGEIVGCDECLTSLDAWEELRHDV